MRNLLAGTVPVLRSWVAVPFSGPRAWRPLLVAKHRSRYLTAHVDKSCAGHFGASPAVLSHSACWSGGSVVSFAQVAPGPCGPVPRDLVLLWLEPKLSVIVTLKLCCDIVAYAT